MLHVTAHRADWITFDLFEKFLHDPSKTTKGVGVQWVKELESKGEDLGISVMFGFFSHNICTATLCVMNFIHVITQPCTFTDRRASPQGSHLWVSTQDKDKGAVTKQSDLGGRGDTELLSLLQSCLFPAVIIRITQISNLVLSNSHLPEKKVTCLQGEMKH